MIYLASPYSHPDPLVMKTRFLLAEQVTAGLLATCQWTYSPIVHCHELASKYKLPTDFNYWKAYNLHMLRRAESFAVLTIPGWQESKGVTGELDAWQEWGGSVDFINAEGRFISRAEALEIG